METPNYDLVLRGKAIPGECPLWSPGGDALYWIDHFGHSFNRLDPFTGTNRTWAMPSAIGSFAFSRMDRS